MITTPHQHGEDITFSLPNPRWRMAGIGSGLIALSITPYFIDTEMMRGSLMRVMALFLTAVGLFFLWSALRIAGVAKLSVVVTSRDLQLPMTTPGEPAMRVDLEDIERVLTRTQNGRRQALVFETVSGESFMIAAIMLPAEVEAAISRLVLRRAALCRAGIDSRSELAAAEAYLAALASSNRPFGVRVTKREGEGSREVHVLATRDEVDTAKKGVVVYVPAPVFAVLEGSGTARGFKPLRGVD